MGKIVIFTLFGLSTVEFFLDLLCGLDEEVAGQSGALVVGVEHSGRYDVNALLVLPDSLVVQLDHDLQHSLGQVVFSIRYDILEVLRQRSVDG